MTVRKNNKNRGKSNIGQSLFDYVLKITFVVSILLIALVNVKNSMKLIETQNHYNNNDHRYLNDSSNLRKLQNHQEEPEEPGWNTIHVFYGKEENLEKKGHGSQVKQDQVIMGLLNNQREGYFVDLAANDAYELSNTFRLEEELQWHGLCIEPNPMYWDRLSHRKNCTIVAAVIGGNERMQPVDFVMHEGKKMASGGIVHEEFDNHPVKKKSASPPKKKFTVPVLEIFQKFKAPKVIDYLSLDVEGAEYMVMKDFPFDQYKFRIMTIERPKQELVDLLYNHGYQYVATFNKWGDETLWIHSSEEKNLDMEYLYEKSKLHFTHSQIMQMGENKSIKPLVHARDSSI